MKKDNEKKPDKPKTEAEAKKPKLHWYMRLPYYLTELPQLTPLDKQFMSCLLAHFGKNDITWPGTARLARKLGTSQTSIVACVKRCRRLS